MNIDKFKLSVILKECIHDSLELIKKQKEIDREKGWSWTFEYHEKYPTMTFRENGLPSFHLSSYSKIDYSKFLIKDKNYKQFESWKKFYNYILENEDLRKYFQLMEYTRLSKNAKEESLTFYNDLYTHYYLTDYVDSYIHFNQNSLKFEESVFSLQFEKYFKAISNRKLDLTIAVPILFIIFDFDEYKIDDRISIKRIEEPIQLARSNKKSYTSSSHDDVISGATHAFYIENWTIDNEVQMNKEFSLADINSFTEPRPIIEKLFGALRLILNSETGFCQILSIPKGWSFRDKADIPEIFVASERNYPEKFENYGWNENKPLVAKNELENFSNFFSKLNNQQFELPIKRLNAALIRKNDEDSIIDITIALESLLTNDSTSEISYRLSVRVTQLCKLSKFKDFDSNEIFELCKKIYNYRSAVVHGDIKRIEKTRNINSAKTKEIKIIELSAELLRHLIKVMIENNIQNNKDIDKLFC